MLNQRTLQRINGRTVRPNRLTPAAIGAGSLALAVLLALILDSPPSALAVLAAGTLGALGVYVAQRRKTITRLDYDLDADTAARFDDMQRALNSLASAEKVWRITEETGQRNQEKKSDVTGSVSSNGRHPVRVGRLKAPGIRANLPIMGIDASGQKLYFLPEALLVLEERYKPVSYESLRVTVSSRSYTEEEEVPSDAKVVGSTWRYTREDGSPDHRYPSNPEIPIVLYARLKIRSPSGLEMLLLVSDRDAAAGFARAFGAGARAKNTGKAARKDPAGAGQRRVRSERNGYEPPRNNKLDAKTEAALKVLGVAGGASVGEINAAYREMARIYHPDKVANESPEVQEYAEHRMKEINAAYAQLRRQSSVHTGDA